MRGLGAVGAGRFLRPGGAVLPDQATLHIAGGGAHAGGLGFWDDVYGFDMSLLGEALNEVIPSWRARGPPPPPFPNLHTDQTSQAYPQHHHHSPTITSVGLWPVWIAAPLSCGNHQCIMASSQPGSRALEAGGRRASGTSPHGILGCMHRRRRRTRWWQR